MINVQSLSKFKILSGSILKIIAAVAMIFDHAALLLGPEIPFLSFSFFTLFGKEISLYFIMKIIGRFAFPIYCFLAAEGLSHTRNRKKHLLGLLIFAVVSEIPFNLMLSGKLFYFGRQNIFFTLLLGGILAEIYDSEKEGFKKAILLLCVLAAAMFGKVDYGMAGVALILVLYIFKNQKSLQTVLSLPLLASGIPAYLAFVPINMYNGERG
ncbi:MAG: TraX protein, partial [Clostridia bacterium]|nr:TraX protein [Clostridia bacterium]